MNLEMAYRTGRPGRLVLYRDLYLKNRKHVPCFYRVIETLVKVWENEKCCGNTSRRRVFS